MLHAVDAFVAGLVRQPGRAGHVADGVETGHARAAVAVGDDVGLLDLHAEGLQAHVLDIADNADGDDGHVGLELLGLAGGLQVDGDARGALGQLLDGRADAELQPATFEHLLGGGRDVGVLHRQDAVERLDHGHVRTQGAEEAGELDADGARADHDQRLRGRLGHQGLAVGPHLVAVRLHADGGDGAGAGAGGQDHVLGLHRAAAAGLERDHHLGRGRALLQLGRPLDDLDLVLLHQERHAAVQLLGDGARPLDDLVEVEALAFDLEAVALQVPELLIELAGLEQGLGRDTAPVEADAAEQLALDHGGLETQLGGADRGHVAAGAAADDDDVEIHVCLSSRTIPIWDFPQRIKGPNAKGSDELSPRRAWSADLRSGA